MYPPKTVFHTVMIPYHICDGLSLSMRIHGHCIDRIESVFYLLFTVDSVFSDGFYISVHASIFREIMNVEDQLSQISFFFK